MSYNASKLKAQLNMAGTRFSMAANKKSALSKQQTREIAKMLQEAPPKEEKARIKAEALIRDDNTIEAFQLLKLNCEILSEQIKLISYGKGCPPDLVESVSTLIWASTIVDISELVEIRKQFRYKYGKEFEEDAVRNARGVVNERVASKLSVQPPSAYLVEVYLETIANEHGVKWKPKVPLKASEICKPTNAPVGESLPARGGSGLVNVSAPPMPSFRTMAPSIREGQSKHMFAKDIKEEDIFVPGATKSEPLPAGKGGHDEDGDDVGECDGMMDLMILGQCQNATKTNIESMNSSSFKRSPFANDMITPTSEYNAPVSMAPTDKSKERVDAGSSEWESEVVGGENRNVSKPGRRNGIKGDEDMETCAKKVVKEMNDYQLCANDEHEEEPAVVVMEDVPSLRESPRLEREMLDEPMSHIPGPDPPSNLGHIQTLLGPLEQTEENSTDAPAPSQNKPSKKGRSARQVGGAAVAGTVAGLVVGGPIAGVAAGGAAAYTAAKVNNSLGDAARKSGEAVACAGEKAKKKAKELDEKHKIVASTKKLVNNAAEKSKEIDEKHHVVEKSKDVAYKVAVAARNLDEKHQVTSMTKVAASNAIAKAKDVNEKHQVTKKTKTVAKLTMNKVMLGVKFISKEVGGDKNDFCTEKMQ